MACGVGHLVGIGNKLPGMVIVGAMRAGTTSLFSFLARHPQVAASFCKEVHYFDLRFHHGPAWYRCQFRRPRRLAGGRAIGIESSPYYMFDPRVPGRMAALVPDVKLVFLLRDPVERAFSHYRKNCRDGREPLSFADALAAEDERLAGEEERMLHDPAYLSGLHQYYSYAARGRYAEQLIRWRQHFSARRCSWSIRPGCSRLPPRCWPSCSHSLDSNHGLRARFYAVNAGSNAMPLDPHIASRLATTFIPHERRLAALVGWCPSRTGQVATATRAEAA